MRSLALFLSFLIIFPEFAAAQPSERSEYFSRDTVANDAYPGIAVSNTDSLKIENKVVRGNFLRVDTSPDIKYRGDLREYFNSGNGVEKYMVSVDLGDLLWSARHDEGSGNGRGFIMIGLKKPYYRISGAPFITGRLDLRLAGSFFGIENRGFITLSYDVRTESRLRQLSSKITFEQISFALYFPFGKRR